MVCEPCWRDAVARGAAAVAAERAAPKVKVLRRRRTERQRVNAILTANAERAWNRARAGLS
jgi:hypothetical protein